MSRIPDLGEHFENLSEIMEQYENELLEAEEHLAIKGKMLEEANRENASWQVYYDQRRIELKSLTDYMEAKVKSVRGKWFRKYSETYSVDLSDRAKDKYIDNETEYLTILECYLSIKELLDKYQAVVDGFQTRGYALNNITKARVSEVYDVTL